MSNQNTLQTFCFSINTVRVILVDGNPWFVAKDVANILGYKNTKDAISRHCREVVKRDLPSLSGFQDTTTIPESDLYRLIFRSKLPAAERFEDWVTKEVLPQIRRTGSYSITDQPKPKRASREDMIKFKQAIDHLCRFCFRAEGSAKHAIYGIFREELNLNNFSELRADQVEKAQQILMEIMDYSKLYSDCVRMFEQSYIEQGLRGKNPLGSITLMIDEHTYQGVKAKVLSQMHR